MSIDERCIRQVTRPKVSVEEEGKGNCIECQPHAANKYCKYYISVSENNEKVLAKIHSEEAHFFQYKSSAQNNIYTQSGTPR